MWCQLRQLRSRARSKVPSRRADPLADAFFIALHVPVPTGPVMVESGAISVLAMVEQVVPRSRTFFPHRKHR